LAMLIGAAGAFLAKRRGGFKANFVASATLLPAFGQKRLGYFGPRSGRQTRPKRKGNRDEGSDLAWQA
jgi:hypothetical protein